MSQIDAIRRRFRDDFLYYAPRALKIRTKAGGLDPLNLNRAQMYVHEKLESQLSSLGKIRAMLLKGRQQGMCLDPGTRVLTADLRWVPVKDIKQGDELVACDEHATGGDATTRRPRKLRTARVERSWSVRKEAYRISFDDGRSVVCSSAHRWLSRKSDTRATWRAIDGSHSKCNDSRACLVVGDEVRSICEAWGEPTLDDAWFGGVTDGEGSLDYKNRSGVDLAVSQRAGDVLDRMIRHCSLRKYSHFIVSDDGPRKTKLGQEPVHAVSVSSIQSMFRLLGLSRPVRFIGVRWWDGKRMPDNGWRRIVSIEPVGDRDLIDIQTSTGTFIAEGLVSHNSTYVEGRFYWRTSMGMGKRAFILTHEDKATKNLFSMAQRYHEHCPDALKPHAKNESATELYFDRLDSGYAVATAGTKNVGRSATAQYLHGSERSFWPNAADHLAGIGQTVPDLEGTEIIFETTANGIANEFYGAWQQAVKGVGDYIAIFVPWFWQTEYSRTPPKDFDLSDKDERYMKLFGLSEAQMAWRHFKIVDDFKGNHSLFDQEYPGSPDLGFTRSEGDPVVPVHLVLEARKTKLPASGKRIMGVDPAEYGDDDTHFSLRQGRVVPHEHRIHGMDVMQVAGAAKVKALEWRADIVNVDATGIGAGVWAALKEILPGVTVNRVMFGESADDKERFRNRRDELGWYLHEWFKEGPTQIPDDDAYASELTAPNYEFKGANRRFEVESKEHMKKVRKIPSPDAFDSTLLTFAHTSSAAPERPAGIQRVQRGSWRV